MPARPLTERVEILEQKVGNLELLPDRVAAVESQILQLRGEVQVGFSAILARVQEGDEESRRHARTQQEEFLTRLEGGLENSRQHAQTLHEDVLTRLEGGFEE